DERPQVGTAHAALACAGTGEGGPLHELQLPESSFPHRIEVLHCHACARTHDTPIRTARNRSALGRGPDHAYLARHTHASEDVPGIRAEIDHRRVALPADLLTALVADDHRRHSSLAFEANELSRQQVAFHALRRRSHRHDPSQIDSRPGEDRKSTRLNSSHVKISYAVFCLKKKREL